MSAKDTPPPLRQLTQFYLAAIVSAAVGLMLVSLAFARFPSAGDTVLVVVFTVFVALSLIKPLTFAYRAQVNLDTAVVVAALLLLEPGHAMLVATLGACTASMIQRRTRAEILFNTSQLTLQVAVGAAILQLLGWQGEAGHFHWPEPVIATMLVGIAMHAVNMLAVAGMISLQDRTSVLGVWYDLTFRSNKAEIIAHAAQLGIGLLAAVVATAEPWSLVLLMLPAIAVYISLEQHVDLRRRAEQNLEAAQHIARLGSWDWDLRTGDQRWSAELFSILGLPHRETIASSENYLGAVHPDDRTAVAAALGAAASSGTPYTIDHRIVPQDGEEERIIHARGDVVLGKNGRPARVVGTVHDITDRKRLEQRLEHQAFHDPLTDLPNRLFFTQKLDHALNRSGNRAEIAVLFLDLDRFKLINDTFGHEAGDTLLTTVADRLRACTRPGDIVARIGGDEFTILLNNVYVEEDAIVVAERIIDEITDPIVLLGTREVVISTSIGIVRPGPDHHAGADLLRDADNALYRAKERGRNQFALFDATMGAETQDRVAIEGDLRRAIERNELRVLYQPKVDLATGRAVAVEAFVRWLHPIRGWVSPAAFIPIAEETGMIQPIGRWILREACIEAATWSSLTHDPPVMSVNLSGKQLHDPEFVTELDLLLKETKLAPNRLRLEITETVAMQNADATIQALWRLHKQGVRVVIDDFGTGYSSLSSLQRFPVDTLQLDQTFVANLGRNKEATTIAQAVIGLAHGLGLKVVAEGVERQEQLSQLQGLGCEQAQGNFFSEPMTSLELGAYLTRQAQGRGAEITQLHKDRTA